ncbi:MAG TPA: GGDEF domain-containing protein, partial [Burkholderiaceae bacterium]|nr:GGDEF domain-containing protein [Burkholderiaceae bacterium]
TEWPTTVLSAGCLSLYLLVFAQGAYRRSLCLHEAREKLREGERAMQTANQRLRRQLDEIHALQTQLREQANRDPLTGLYNRRFFDTVIDRELARSAREGKPLALMLIDIDHFKQINDTHGHLAGDRVLGRLAAVLGENSRGTDVVCRFGGEEFVMLMPDMPAVGAIERAELIRRTISSPCCGLDDEAQPVTVSIGIASFPEHGRCAQQLVRHADLALYRAKDEGRDRTVSFEPQIAILAD